MHWALPVPVLLLAAVSLSEESACQSSNIYCYVCDTNKDENCEDPFNYTLPQEKLPPLMTCIGCCIKMVFNDGKSNERVRRTCTSLIDLKVGMVDHVCMMESSGTGHMCICEEDRCNAAVPLHQPLSLFQSFLVSITLLAASVVCMAHS